MHFSTFNRILILSFLLILAGCPTAPPVDSAKDLAGIWDTPDSRKMSAQLADDVLHRSWVLDFTQSNNRPPLLTLGEVNNHSRELIDLNAFAKDIERELSISSRVKFVSSDQGRKNAGADYMMKIALNYTDEGSGKQATRVYQADITLIRLSDKHTVYTGKQQLRKAIPDGMKR